VTIETRLWPGFLLPAQITTCHRATMRESIVILAQARTQTSSRSCMGPRLREDDVFFLSCPRATGKSRHDRLQPCRRDIVNMLLHASQIDWVVMSDDHGCAAT
jgi:hypothetical protein